MSKYWLITYGCQMNRSDSERIAATLENVGYLPASNISEANLILINACSVRQSAIDRIWGQTQAFDRLRMHNKKLKTALTGCVLKEDRKKFKNKFDLILDIRDLSKLPEKLLSASNSSDRWNKEKTERIEEIEDQVKDYFKIEPKYQSSFSAYIPVMTGCDNFCTFCAVPYTRGRETSRPVEEILCEAKNLINRGYKEVWLLGQNVNSYSSKQGTENKEQVLNFANLLQMVNDIPGNFWVRFTSSHPKDFFDKLIETMANCEKVTEYLNLPVQSGDNKVLRKMNRPYMIEQYKEKIRKIREKIPEISLSTDVIVGFPGETEKQFQNTVKLFKEIKYDMAYIAKYSPRAGTAAFKLKDNVPLQEKERRWKVLAGILKETALAKNKEYIGKVIEVLPDENKNGFLTGKSRAYKTVKFKGPKILIGQFVKVEISEALPWGLKGEIVK